MSCKSMLIKAYNCFYRTLVYPKKENSVIISHLSFPTCMNFFLPQSTKEHVLKYVSTAFFPFCWDDVTRVYLPVFIPDNRVRGNVVFNKVSVNNYISVNRPFC